jgi:hypothetical protein
MDFYDSLILNNHARGMSVAKSSESTTKQHRVAQKSRELDSFVVATTQAHYCQMEPPTDPQEKRSSYWIRGPSTRRHSYFYPSDDRAGMALMLLIGILGLVALGFGIKNILGSPEGRMRDVILCGIGLIAAVIGLYQAYRLRP